MIYEFSDKKRLVGWVFLQVEMKCETKVISNSTGTNAK